MSWKSIKLKWSQFLATVKAEWAQLSDENYDYTPVKKSRPLGSLWWNNSHAKTDGKTSVDA